ncbi:MAG: hypothetical protein NXI32_09275 [bacterium]|nr:hypothetical protein [bacterium]
MHITEVIRIARQAEMEGRIKIPKVCSTEELLQIAQPLLCELEPPKPNVPKEEHYVSASYRYVDELHKIPAAPSDKLLITVATGDEHERLLGLSGYYMERYARRIGADFIALTGVTQDWWGLEKFRVGQFVARYRRTLFLDVDVLVREGSPDLFRLVPEGMIGIHDDYPHSVAIAGNDDWMKLVRDHLHQSQQVPLWNPETLLNTGVVVLDRMHADIYQPMRRPFPGHHCDEQFWIERQASRYPSYKLPSEFNTQWYWPDFEERCHTAWFVHLANCPPHERFKLMCRKAEEHDNYRPVDARIP